MARKGKEKKEHIVHSIRLVWDSLDSHLDAAIGHIQENECCNKAVGEPPFHKKCVREYLFILASLVDEL